MNFIFKLLITLFTLGISLSALQAQSASKLETFLDKPAADLATAAYYVLAAAGAISAEAGPAEALRTAAERGMIDPGRDPDAPVSLGEFSFLAVRAFGLSGGLMYKLLPGPRYAVRELSYRRIISGTRDPGRPLSGEEVVRYAGRIAEYVEKRRAP